MLFILFALSVTIAPAGASSLAVAYPLEDQLPPIARIHTPYSCPLTFSSSILPSWLSFDPATLSLSGTPQDDDEGRPRVTIIASNGGAAHASSSFDLCVTPYPPPTLHIPIENQFHRENPSLSSVYLVSNRSSLYGSRPALRIPPKWSFSIGLDYNTFDAKNNLYYDARQADGSPLPSWVNFNTRALTFNGVTPAADNTTMPHTLSVALHASDEEGYSAVSAPFDIVVADHDFSLDGETNSDSLPTINVTAGQPFELALNSAVDFIGVQLDGKSVTPDNITALEIDTSDLESWLRYDSSTRTLSGEPPSDFKDAVLPVLLASSVNQTLSTVVTLVAVPSFFSSGDLDPILVTPGDGLTFYLAQYFSNSSDLGTPGDVQFGASFDPPAAGDNLQFNASSFLAGTVPKGVSFDHISNKHGAKGLSDAARKKLLLGLEIAFALISVFVGLAIVFACIRKCARDQDSVIMGEEGQRAWTASEKRWYGIGIEVNGEKCTPELGTEPRQEGTFGSALSRILTRTASSRPRSPLSPVGLTTSPRMIKKVDFMGRARRMVSDQYKRVVSGPKRPVISKPVLILTSDDSPASRLGNIPTTGSAGLLGVGLGSRDFKPLDDSNFSQYAPSGPTSLATSSPTSSHDAPSIPRRRLDFASPRPPMVITTPPEAHLPDDAQPDSAASSLKTSSTHESDAIVQRATRATSVRSGASGMSFHVLGRGHPTLESARPRLVPFTSATRVPVPKVPTSSFSPDMDIEEEETRVGASAGPTRRVASQVARVFRGQRGSTAELPAQPSADDLATGMEYVRALGDDGRSSLAPSSQERSPALSAMSFSSLESSAASHGRIERVLARTGERFKFRVPVVAASRRGLDARLTSGLGLPGFIHFDADAAGAEVWGVPAGSDLGVHEVGVYERGGACVGRVVVEVVERKAA
ncbi:uncharacterized protein BXZ73DRAFT_93274 [Epithele typhae]|uniref:uncharacterized protein n=1 Tax=Epithele typhae TaxID=378194 RepID=UPI002007C260|nr:uncharacterized protein BXZ73DRAFT_93274 [Epithele typhae]KAH9912102.1 hypothetical protein BXZ73DRAFT_93274 [Epithele typhae]